MNFSRKIHGSARSQKPAGGRGKYSMAFMTHRGAHGVGRKRLRWSGKIGQSVTDRPAGSGVVRDITYARMKWGFLYLVAAMDWHGRAVLSWRMSNTLNVDFCVAALEEAIIVMGPEIFNTCQGSQFTGLNSPRRSRIPATLPPWVARAGG